MELFYFIHAGTPTSQSQLQESSEDEATAAYCLTLPGRKLYLTPLLSMKKFRKRGNKGAIRAFYKLEENGLGKVLELSGSKGTSTVCMDCNVLWYLHVYFGIFSNLNSKKFQFLSLRRID